MKLGVLTAVPDRLSFIENGFHQARFGKNHVKSETILNVFPGASDHNRLVLVRCVTMCGHEHLTLRQESYSPDVGWYAQSGVAIEPGQVAGLKMTLSPNNHRPTINRIDVGSRTASQSSVNKSSSNGATANTAGSPRPTLLKLHEAV